MIKESLALSAFVIAAGWLPYIFLEAFWMLLVRSDPSKVHGEEAGPILFFLPVLLAVGIIGTACVFVFWAAYVLWRKADRKLNPIPHTNIQCRWLILAVVVGFFMRVESSGMRLDPATDQRTTEQSIVRLYDFTADKAFQLAAAIPNLLQRLNVNTKYGWWTPRRDCCGWMSTNSRLQGWVEQF